MSRYTSIFSFYGGKSKLSHLYPPPKYSQIIEPFAGGAGYSLRYAERSVWINDLDPKVFAIWSFLLSQDALRWVDQIPLGLNPGSKVSQLPFLQEAPIGLLYLLQAEANHGTQGAKGERDQVTPMGARCWPRVRPRLLYQIPRIVHWRVTNLPYQRVISPQAATWFVDPPYMNHAGSCYRQQPGDFASLGAWCQELPGQVIVCENQGATWLPFQPLARRRGVRSRYQVSEAGEVVWISDQT